MLLATNVFSDIATLCSHVFTTKSHSDHCVICSISGSAYKRQKTFKTGLNLLPMVFPTDNELLKTNSNLKRTAIIFSPIAKSKTKTTVFCSFFTELNLLLTSSGFDVCLNIPSEAAAANILFLFVDMRNKSLRKTLLKSILDHSSMSTNTTVLQLVDDVSQTLFIQIPPNTTIITCIGIEAVRAFILYSLKRKSRFTVFELIGAFSNDANLIVQSSCDKRITSILL